MHRIRLPLLVLGAALALAGTAALRADEAAPDLKQPQTFAVRLVEGGLIPGQAGTIEVTITLQDPRVHIEATATNLAWSAEPQPGVEVDLAKVAYAPEPTEHLTEWGDVLFYRVGTFTARMPVRLLADAPADAQAVLKARYILCSNDACGAPLDQVLRVPLRKAAPGAAAARMTGPRRPVQRGGATVSVRLRDEPQRAVVRIEPSFGHHIYLPPKQESGLPISVGVLGGKGVTWGKVEIPLGGEQHDPVEIEIPVTIAEDAESLSVVVTWQACNATGCLTQEKETFTFVRAASDGGAAVVVEPTEVVPRTRAEPAFPVVDDDEFEGGISAEGLIQQKLRETGLLLTLFFVFLVGAGLTFTPCVFPIIPLVVATIAGGQSVAKKRLLMLLGVYVLGLSLAFATMGLVAAFTGTSLSAAFESPWFIGGMALFFIVLSFGMLGLFELQPPQWLMRLQGGAQARGGSVLGAFMLGALGAVLASPCTGPVIVGMLAAISATGDAFLGFSLFFTFGLGMGLVIALFGMANMALRPGPWMVWVRYVFGVLLFGGAMFYVANSALLPRPWLWAGGSAVALLSGLLLAWHVIRREREPRPVGVKRGVIVTGFYVLALALVMYLNRPAEGLPWTYVRDVDHLKAEVAKATAAGKPVIVDFWAIWCQKCKEYDHVMADDADLQARLGDWVRLKVDVGDDTRDDLRDAVLAEPGAQPYLAFIDAQGRLRTQAGAGWLGTAPGEGSDHERTANRLRERLERLAP